MHSPRSTSQMMRSSQYMGFRLRFAICDWVWCNVNEAVPSTLRFDAARGARVILKPKRCIWRWRGERRERFQFVGKDVKCNSAEVSEIGCNQVKLSETGSWIIPGGSRLWRCGRVRAPLQLFVVTAWLPFRGLVGVQPQSARAERVTTKRTPVGVELAAGWLILVHAICHVRGKKFWCAYINRRTGEEKNPAGHVVARRSPYLASRA